ncbi:tetratricopeptide repeat protein [Candidatus Calescamantes bacterium]|nr:tetratricopeptide repeat protein [Candidatus Calescamantes bacterium]
MKEIEELFDKAKTLSLRGKWKEARSIYEGIIRKEERLPGVYLGLGEIALREGKPEVAEDYFRKEREKGKVTPRVEQLLAVTLILQGRRKEAIKELEYSLRLAPEDYRPYIYLGYIYLEEGEIDRAQGWLEMAKEGGIESLALDLYLARIYYLKKEREKLVRVIKKADEKLSLMRKALSSPLLDLVEGELKLLNGNFKEAIALIEKGKQHFIKGKSIFEAGIIYSLSYIEGHLG